VGIAARNKNASETDLDKWEEIAISRVTELKKSDLAIVLSGEKGKCEYKLPFSM
jgi:hypothetical protein